jgi:hypothetical protein
MTNDEMVEHYVKGVTAACGLDVNEAKTIIYYSIATHGIACIQMMPVLVLRGPQGTGKSTIMALLKQMVYSPRFIDGRVSSAVLRDNLKYETTALIEEADGVDEELLIKRYSRQTSGTVVKRGGAMQGFKDEKFNIFGATILHRRVPFKDAALDSRSIVIRTIFRPGVYPMPTLSNSILKDIANKIEWGEVLGLPSGRVTDVWNPLFKAALACNEKDWTVYALDELIKGNKRLTAGHRYETEYALVYSLQALFYQNSLLNAPEPIVISDVKRHLKEYYDISLKNYQIEEMVRNLGFKITRPHGYSTVQPDNKLLRELLDNIQTDV